MKLGECVYQCLCLLLMNDEYVCTVLLAMFMAESSHCLSCDLGDLLVSSMKVEEEFVESLVLQW